MQKKGCLRLPCAWEESWLRAWVIPFRDALLGTHRVESYRTECKGVRCPCLPTLGLFSVLVGNLLGQDIPKQRENIVQPVFSRNKFAEYLLAPSGIWCCPSLAPLRYLLSHAPFPVTFEGQGSGTVYSVYTRQLPGGIVLLVCFS